MRKRKDVVPDTREMAKAADDFVASLPKQPAPEAPPAAAPPLPTRIEFPSANRVGDVKEKPMRAEFETIVETIFVEHPLDEYKRLEEALRVGANRSDLGSVNRALDDAEHNARSAHRLWMTAKVERENWELDNSTLHAAMHKEAMSMLQREKEQGTRTKQITDSDVQNAIALLYPDEYRHQEVRRKKVKAMEDSMAHLCEMWGSRCRSLQAMLAKIR